MNSPQYSKDLQLEKGYEALNWLVDQSSQRQEKVFIPNDINGGQLANAMENCTIMFKTARQSGHTSLLVRLAYERFNNAIIVTPTQKQQKYMRDQFLTLTIKNYPQTPFTMGNFMTSKLLALPPNKVYHFVNMADGDDGFTACREYHTEAILVDCASLALEEEIESIYRNLGPCMTAHSKKFFVFFQ